MVNWMTKQNVQILLLYRFFKLEKSLVEGDIKVIDTLSGKNIPQTPLLDRSKIILRKF